jgi:hypothetical protein
MDEHRLKLLGIYLQDHLAGAMVGVNLAKRALSENQDNDFANVLRGVTTEIEQDRQTLIRIADSLGIRRDRLKETLAWLLEKAGRLKLNGQLTGYSPLSRVVELEGLMTGITGKLGLWRVLERVAEADDRLDRDEIRELIARAERQRDQVERERLRAAELAFLGGSVEAPAATRPSTSPQDPARAT